MASLINVAVHVDTGYIDRVFRKECTNFTWPYLLNPVPADVLATRVGAPLFLIKKRFGSYSEQVAVSRSENCI